MNRATGISSNGGKGDVKQDFNSGKGKKEREKREKKMSSGVGKMDWPITATVAASQSEKSVLFLPWWRCERSSKASIDLCLVLSATNLIYDVRSEDKLSRPHLIFFTFRGRKGERNSGDADGMAWPPRGGREKMVCDEEAMECWIHTHTWLYGILPTLQCQSRASSWAGQLGISLS